MKGFSDSLVSAKVTFDYLQPCLLSHFITYGGRENSKIPALLVRTPYNPLLMSLGRTCEWHGTDAPLIS